MLWWNCYQLFLRIGKMVQCGIRARGGITVDMTWKDGQVATLTLVAQKKCRIVLKANGVSQVIKLKKGKNVLK